jgi:FAD/FMN-containing dehydrogenase
MVPPMPLSPSQIAAELVSLLGEDSVIADVSRMATFLNEPRKRFHQTAVAVARPRDVAAVQAVARWANEKRVPLIPQGGNTGLVGAQVPLSGDEVIVSIQRLTAIRGINAGAGHITVEAGLTLEEVHRAAEAEDALFPLWIGSEGSARVGGILGSNAGGVQVLSYGNARELCLGIEAVLADGRLYNGLGSLRKDNTGYDLRNLLVGSEGTLAITTAATLKLFPKPEAYETAIANVASPKEALELLYLLKERAGSRLSAFELLPRMAFDLQLTHQMITRDPTASPSPWYAMIEVNRMKGGVPGALQAGLEEALGTGIVTDAVLAESEGDRIAMWVARDNMNDVQVKEGASIKHDVSVPIAMVPRLIEEGSARAAALVPGIRALPFGHMGDGNIHFNFSQPVGADQKAFMAGAEPIHEAVYDLVVQLGGSVSAEHGIGQLKTELLKQVKDPVALEMMRAIKRTLDPNGILNPGKMLA